MPGYMMHLCEGCYILKQIFNSDVKNADTALSKQISSLAKSPHFSNDFLLGTVIPDAVPDKSSTHFRPAWQHDLITKYPDMQQLISSHNLKHLTAADLGILTHLHMDALYVQDFWPRYFQFEDVTDKPTCVTADIDHIRMKETSMQPKDTLIPRQMFFSDNFFYGDYNVTNPMFQEDFAPSLPQITPVALTIYKDADFSYDKLQHDLSCFISSLPLSSRQITHVFPYNDLKDFIIVCAEKFLYLY